MDNNNNGNNGGGATVEADDTFFITFFVLLVFFMIFVFCCCRREDTSGVPGSAGPAPNISVQEETMSPEERKAEIEATLITRKVVAAEDHAGSTRFLGKMMDTLGSNERTYSSFVAAFSSMGKSNRSIEFSDPQQYRSSSAPNLSIPQAISEDDPERKSASVSNIGSVRTNDNDEEIALPPPQDEIKEEEEAEKEQHDDKESAKPRRKCNIVARTISTSLRSSSSHPTTCDICLMDYEVGEDVCWSPNEECIHVYHKECIVDWLLKSPDCPCCRRNYLEKSSNDNPENAAAGPEP